MTLCTLSALIYHGYCRLSRGLILRDVSIYTIAVLQHLVFSADEPSLETELKVVESLLEQAEKQSKERQAKEKIKNARKEIGILAKRAHEGRPATLF